MVLEDSDEIGINYCLCLPKAELETKNSTKRRRKASFGCVFGFQLDLLEKNLFTLLACTFITYICNPADRKNQSDSGYYLNVYPWIPWRKGKSVPVKAVHDGERAEKRSVAKMKLREKHKEAEKDEKEGFKVLKTQHNNRIKLLKLLKLDIKRALNPIFN